MQSGLLKAESSIITRIYVVLCALLSVLTADVSTSCTCVGCRTDCIFSPDDKLVITGTSVKKGDGVGKLVFLDRQTLKISAELDVAPASACPPFLLLFVVRIVNHLHTVSVTEFFNELIV